MRTDLLSTLRAAALAGAACLSLPGCNDAGVADAVARVGDARPAVREAVTSPPQAAMPAAAPRALPLRPTGGAALDTYREDLDPSHAALASYAD